MQMKHISRKPNNIDLCFTMGTVVFLENSFQFKVNLLWLQVSMTLSAYRDPDLIDLIYKYETHTEK